MRSILLLLIIGSAAAAPRYVFEMLKPALTAEEVNLLKNQRDLLYPTYSEIPKTSFNCASKKQAGYYADTETRCQVFHRCDLAGNMYSYLCANGTIFNQITLVCDSHYNVDCSKSRDYEDFQNERLYTKQDLFDSPPKEMYLDSASGVLKPVGTDTGISLKRIDNGYGKGGYGTGGYGQGSTSGDESTEDAGTMEESDMTTKRATTKGKATTGRRTTKGGAAAGGRTTARKTTKRTTTTTMAPEETEENTGGDAGAEEQV